MDRSTPAPPLLIFAVHYRQACDWARAHNFGREGRRWRYVSAAHQAFGYHGPGHYLELHIPGQPLSLHRGEERREVLRYLRSHGFTPLPW